MILVGTSSTPLHLHKHYAVCSEFCHHRASGCGIESIRTCLATLEEIYIEDAADALNLERMAQSQEPPRPQRVLFSALLLGLALLVCAYAIGTRCTYRPCHRIHRDIDQGQAPQAAEPVPHPIQPASRFQAPQQAPVLLPGTTAARDIDGVHQHQQQKEERDVKKQGDDIGKHRGNRSTTFIYGSPSNVLLIAIDISRMAAV